jgi:hypothetical protein
MHLFAPLTLPNGTSIPNRIANAAMEENMCDADPAHASQPLAFWPGCGSRVNAYHLEKQDDGSAERQDDLEHKCDDAWERYLHTLDDMKHRGLQGYDQWISIMFNIMKLSHEMGGALHSSLAKRGLTAPQLILGSLSIAFNALSSVKLFEKFLKSPEMVTASAKALDHVTLDTTGQLVFDEDQLLLHAPPNSSIEEKKVLSGIYKTMCDAYLHEHGWSKNATGSYIKANGLPADNYDFSTLMRRTPGIKAYAEKFQVNLTNTDNSLLTAASRRSAATTPPAPAPVSVPSSFRP